jgi:hypothetical protein
MLVASGLREPRTALRKNAKKTRHCVIARK